MSIIPQQWSYSWISTNDTMSRKKDSKENKHGGGRVVGFGCLVRIPLKVAL